MAEAEYRMKRDGWMRVQQSKIAKGIPMRTCFGYQRGPEGRLVPHPDQAPWVTRIFDWRANRTGWREIAARLNDEGAPAPSSKSKRWTPTTVRDLVQRRTYLGEVWHDRDREHVHKGAHEPLVDEVTFAVANSVPAKRYDRHRQHLLAGLLRCAGCRYKLKATTSQPRGGAEYVSYICRGDHAGGRCPAPVRLTELQLLPILRRTWIREANLLGKRFRLVGANGEVTRLRDELAVLEAQYQTWIDDEDMRADDPAEWREGRKRRKGRVDDKREELRVALAAADAAHAPTEVVASWPEERGDQRQLLDSTFQMVFLRDGPEPLEHRLRAFVVGEVAPSVPVPGQSFDLRPFVWDDDPVRAGEATA